MKKRLTKKHDREIVPKYHKEKLCLVDHILLDKDLNMIDKRNALKK